MSLGARLESGAAGGAAITFVGSAAGEAGGTDGIDRVEWARLHDDARAMAAALQRRGIGPGAHVGVLGPTSRPLVTALQAIWLTGATVVALPLPMRLGSLEQFVAQTRQRILHADLALVLVDAELTELLDAPDGLEVAQLHDLVNEARGGERGFLRAADDPERLAILQFTSGSTAEPKGVMLPDRCIVANTDAIVEAAAISPDDTAVSWLPLYHDMGLIGLLLTPMLIGADLVLGAPQDFLAAPAVWLEWISTFRGTITAGPSFSYALAARALRRGNLDVDLSSWRLALNGAEPVDPDAVDAFCAAGAPYGLDAKAAFPVFGMAEATLAVAFPALGAGMEVDVIDRAALELEGTARPIDAGNERARGLAVLGRAVRGLEMRIADRETGAPLGDRGVGELQLRGVSITPGYYRNDDATAAA
ncbi:MAG: AMP-binding protein, partial [Acidimicrobiia bacterium]